MHDGTLAARHWRVQVEEGASVAWRRMRRRWCHVRGLNDAPRPPRRCSGSASFGHSRSARLPPRISGKTRHGTAAPRAPDSSRAKGSTCGRLPQRQHTHLALQVGEIVHARLGALDGDGLVAQPERQHLGPQRRQRIRVVDAAVAAAADEPLLSNAVWRRCKLVLRAAAARSRRGLCRRRRTEAWRR
jgi:hypothetical protein